MMKYNTITFDALYKADAWCCANPNVQIVDFTIDESTELGLFVNDTVLKGITIKYNIVNAALPFEYHFDEVSEERLFFLNYRNSVDELLNKKHPGSSLISYKGANHTRFHNYMPTMRRKKVYCLFTMPRNTYSIPSYEEALLDSRNKRIEEYKKQRISLTLKGADEKLFLTAKQYNHFKCTQIFSVLSLMFGFIGYPLFVLLSAWNIYKLYSDKEVEDRTLIGLSITALLFNIIGSLQWYFVLLQIWFLIA